MITWLTELENASEHFSSLIKKEQDNALMAFDAMKGGLYSKNSNACLLTAKILGALAGELDPESQQEKAWEWFISEDGGLEGIVHALTKHSGIESAAVELMMKIGKGKYQDLFQRCMQNLLPQIDSYWRVLTNLIRPLSELKLDETQEKEINQVLETLIDSGSRLADNDGRHGTDERSAACGFLCEMWLYFPSLCEAKDAIANYILTVLTRSTRDKSLALQCFSLARLFSLLDNFAEGRRPYAPTVYKTLTFSLMELYQSVFLRSFIEDNLASIFTKYPKIPVNIVIEPLAKQIQLDTELNLCDFSFFFQVAFHPKFSEGNAILFLDMISQIMTNDILFSPIAFPSFLAILEKNISEESTKTYAKNYIKVKPHNIYILNSKLFLL